MKQYWIQKGTPDYICDSWEEAQDCQDSPHRIDLPWIGVVEKAVYDQLLEQANKLAKELEAWGSKQDADTLKAWNEFKKAQGLNE